MQDFSPASRPSSWRIPLVLLVALVTLVPIAPLWMLVREDFQVRYTVHDGTLTVDPGDPFTGARTAPR